MEKKFSISTLKNCIIISAITALILCLIPAHSKEPHFDSHRELEEGGSLWDPFLNSAVTYCEEIFQDIGDTVVSAIVGAFSPSFNVLLNLEKGQAATDMTRKYTSDDVYESFTIGTLYNFAKYFGIILANLIFFFNLFICLIGQAEQIKDSPLRLLVKYIAVLVGINISFNIILEIVNFCGGMWSDFVMTSSVGSKLDFSRDFFTNVIQYEDADTGRVSTILNVSVNAYMSIVFTVVLPFVGFFLVWKLFKQFLRLFLEIAERYFVMILLLLFMPAVLATLISNHTRNIFNSYMRMFCCQVFILMCNSAFMKVFIYVLMAGGWTASIMNYILALAFMRVCQRIDTYMLTMGLNAAQTGGGVINAGMGAMRAIKGLLDTLKKADNARRNGGLSMIKNALQSGDYNKFTEGFKLASPISALVSGKAQPPSQLSFAQQMASTPEAKAQRAAGKGIEKEGKLQGDYEKYKQGHEMARTPLERMTGTNTALDEESFKQLTRKKPSEQPNSLNTSSLEEALGALNIPPETIEKLTEKGINPENIAGIRQLDEQGTSFSFLNEKGAEIGYLRNGNVETFADNQTEALVRKEERNGNVENITQHDQTINPEKGKDFTGV